MTANVGRIDRIIRAVVGVVLLALGLGYLGAGVTTPWDWILGIVGAVLLATAVFSICPAYALFGVRTCEQ
ncbi:YgaP family membrane protein [Dichotomicrobium thermohalophilum]|uniref:Inner membrane protein YgaP-like transmembrane domain-containing protein n=1 Tax=Dichotomicrobium thermohalophilum TaxID=933063 RepID=A0A397PKC1_9HYPH|nr:DUF2892 domain-containing protein [Dichotomicrobium thermohalophilum]RIA47597.1 Protein of unknown function (DUF2892) [Dichotomicrobium thermohalophilum]